MHNVIIHISPEEGGLVTANVVRDNGARHRRYINRRHPEKTTALSSLFLTVFHLADDEAPLEMYM